MWISESGSKCNEYIMVCLRYKVVRCLEGRKKITQIMSQYESFWQMFERRPTEHER